MRFILLSLLIISSNVYAEDYNKIIVDKLFPSKTEKEKKEIVKQVKEKAKIQYGNGTIKSNVSPTKDEDVLNNIKSFHLKK